MIVVTGGKMQYPGKRKYKEGLCGDVIQITNPVQKLLLNAG